MNFVEETKEMRFPAGNPNIKIFQIQDTNYLDIGDATNQHVDNLKGIDVLAYNELFYGTNTGKVFAIDLPSNPTRIPRNQQVEIHGSLNMDDEPFGEVIIETDKWGVPIKVKCALEKTLKKDPAIQKIYKDFCEDTLEKVKEEFLGKKVSLATAEIEENRKIYGTSNSWKRIDGSSSRFDFDNIRPQSAGYRFEMVCDTRQLFDEIPEDHPCFSFIHFVLNTLCYQNLDEKVEIDTRSGIRTFKNYYSYLLWSIKVKKIFGEFPICEEELKNIIALVYSDTLFGQCLTDAISESLELIAKEWDGKVLEYQREQDPLRTMFYDSIEKIRVIGRHDKTEAFRLIKLLGQKMFKAQAALVINQGITKVDSISKRSLADIWNIYKRVKYHYRPVVHYKGTDLNRASETEITKALGNKFAKEVVSIREQIKENPVEITRGKFKVKVSFFESYSDLEKIKEVL